MRVASNLHLKESTQRIDLLANDTLLAYPYFLPLFPNPVIEKRWRVETAPGLVKLITKAG